MYLRFVFCVCVGFRFRFSGRFFFFVFFVFCFLFFCFFVCVFVFLGCLLFFLFLFLFLFFLCFCCCVCCCVGFREWRRGTGVCCVWTANVGCGGGSRLREREAPVRFCFCCCCCCCWRGVVGTDLFFLTLSAAKPARREAVEARAKGGSLQSGESEQNKALLLDCHTMPRVPSIDVVDLTGPDVPVVDSQYQATPASSGTGARPTVASASSGGSRGSTSASTSRAISGLVYASTLPSASSQHRHTRSNVTSARSRRFTVHQTVVPRSHSSSSSSGAGGSPLFSGSRLPTNPSPRGSGGSMMLPGAFLMPVLFSSMLGGLGVDVEADVFSSSTGFESLLNLNPFEPMLDLAERRAEQLTFLLQSIPSIRSMMRGPPPAAKKSVRALKTTRVTTAMRKLQDGCVC